MASEPRQHIPAYLLTGGKRRIDGALADEYERTISYGQVCLAIQSKS
jgi:hypothetical protein